MLDAITSLLTVLGTALSARGQGDIGEYLTLAAVLVREGDDTRDELAELTQEIERMVAEQRGPTADERDRVRARRAALSERMQSLGDGTT